MLQLLPFQTLIIVTDADVMVVMEKVNLAAKVVVLLLLVGCLNLVVLDMTSLNIARLENIILNKTLNRNIL